MEKKMSRYYIVPEERLKDFIRTIRELRYENDSRFYMPSDDDLEPTEEDLEEFTEIKEYEYVPNIDEEFANILKKMVNKLNKNCENS